MNEDKTNDNSKEKMLTENIRSIIIIDDNMGDTTVRPRSPEIPRFWPSDVPYPPPPEKTE